MKRIYLRKAALIALLFATASQSAPALGQTQAQAQARIAIIHSYAPDYQWTAGQGEGVESARTRYGWETDVFYLDHQKAGRVEISANVARVRRSVLAGNYAGIIATDDFAAESFLPLAAELSVPVSVSGINGDVGAYLTAGQTAVGTLERYNYIPVVKALMELKPALKEVLVVTDEDRTGGAIGAEAVSQIEEFLSSTVSDMKVRLFTGGSWPILQKTLLNLDSSRSAVIFVAFYRYLDERGNKVDYREIDAWVNRHLEIADVGVAEFHAANGRLLALASDAYECGAFAAEQLDNVMRQRPATLRQHLPLKLIINRKRAKQLGISIPLKLATYATSSSQLSTNKTCKE